MTIPCLLEIIAERWRKTVRCAPDSVGSLIGLPHPYTVPCAADAFQDMYYWDTYFASRGLMLQGFADQVRNNCDNFIYEIERFGFIPNGNRTHFLNRSQPPYFGALVELVYNRYQDKKWLSHAVAALEKEYQFWMDRRRLDCGLLHYGHQNEDQAVFEKYYAGCCVGRMGMPKNPDAETLRRESSHTIAEAESGWDFNPRFERRCLDYAPIDLNSLMFYNEMLLMRFHRELGNPDQSVQWRDRAEHRRELINRYCWSGDRKAFMDYDSRNRKRSPVLSAASLQPLWAGLATNIQAISTVRAMEEFLEYPHGLSTCEPNDSGMNYQWDYPNGWPCLQIVAIDAMDRCGFYKQAERLAEKYVDTVLHCYETSGNIWEKYNVVTGTIEVKDEYKMPAMMGWSAAAFVVAARYLEKIRQKPQERSSLQ